MLPSCLSHSHTHTHTYMRINTDTPTMNLHKTLGFCQEKWCGIQKSDSTFPSLVLVCGTSWRLCRVFWGCFPAQGSGSKRFLYSSYCTSFSWPVSSFCRWMSHWMTHNCMVQLQEVSFWHTCEGEARDMMAYTLWNYWHFELNVIGKKQILSWMSPVQTW